MCGGERQSDGLQVRRVEEVFASRLGRVVAGQADLAAGAGGMNDLAATDREVAAVNDSLLS